MKQLDFFRLSIITFSFLLFDACSPEKSREEMIIGEWQAHWETKPDESFPNLVGDDLQMNGLIKFDEDGKVEISAFGFDGCIFSDDTMTNVLNWKIEDTVLRFIDNGDDHGLPYNIQKFSKAELHLTLLEDINLTLTRN